MGTLFFVYLMAYTLNGDPFSAVGKGNPAALGVETRVLEVIGPYGGSLDECKLFADGQRKRAAVTYKLPSHMLMTYACVPLELSTK
jgi:hypothetical protein